MLSSTQQAGLVSWVEAGLGTGRKAIWADQAGPRPALPFAVLRVTNFDRQYGQTEERQGSTSDKRIYVRNVTHDISLQVFSSTAVGADSALALLSGVLRRLDLQSVRRALVQAGCAVQNVGTPRNLSAALATASESRAQVDFTLSAIETLEETVGHIAHVVAEVELPPFPAAVLTVPPVPEPEPPPEE